MFMKEIYTTGNEIVDANATLNFTGTIRNAAVKGKLTVREMAFIANPQNSTRVMRAMIKELLKNKRKKEE